MAPQDSTSTSLTLKIIASTRHILHTESEERSRILRDVGERIFRPTFTKAGYVRLVTLGSFREVGRSAMLIQAGASTVLLDCGINPGAQDPSSAYPRFDTDEFDLEKLDAVVISHAHLDHCGILPFLYKYGYDGPIYCSEPTQVLMTLHQLVYLDVHSRCCLVRTLLTSDDAVSTVTALAATVTLWLAAPTSIATFSSTLWPTATSKFCVVSLNPACLAVSA